MSSHVHHELGSVGERAVAETLLDLLLVLVGQLLPVLGERGQRGVAEEVLDPLQGDLSHIHPLSPYARLAYMKKVMPRQGMTINTSNSRLLDLVPEQVPGELVRHLLSGLGGHGVHHHRSMSRRHGNC